MRSPWRRAIGGMAAVIVAGAAISGGVYQHQNPSGPPPPPPAGNANLWVDTNGGSCTRQGVAAVYADAAACGSFQAAYTAAQCNDTVGVAAGTYAGQSVSSGSKSCTSTTQVKITSVPGAACTDNSPVKMPSISSSVSYLSFSCFQANTSSTSCAGAGGAAGQHTTIQWISFDHVDVICAFLDSDHLSWSNSTFGPANTCTFGQEDMIDFRADPAPVIQDVVFDRDVFGIVTAPPDFQCGIGEHVDSMQGYGMNGLVVKNSIFYGCPGQCVIFRPFCVPNSPDTCPPGPLTFENNVFNQAQDPGGALSLGTSGGGDACAGLVLVQNNTFVNGANMNGGYDHGAGCSMVIRNNIWGGGFFCGLAGSLDTYTNNIHTTGGGCGSNFKLCTPTYVNPLGGTTSNGDYHLQSSDTCAVGAADQANFPSTDFDGQARPQGPSVDAGMDDIGINITVTKIGEFTQTDHGGGVNWPGPVSFQITGSVPAGDTVLVLHTSTIDASDGGLWVGAGPQVGVSDARGNTYARDYFNQPGGSGSTSEIWATCVTTPLQSGDNVTTIGYPRGMSDVMTILAVHGIACGNTAARLDKTQHGQGFISGGGTATSGATAATIQANELLVGMCSNNNVGITGVPQVVSPTWTEQSDFSIANNINRGQQVVTRSVSATGAYTYNEVLSGGSTVNCLIVTYKTS